MLSTQTQLDKFGQLLTGNETELELLKMKRKTYLKKKYENIMRVGYETYDESIVNIQPVLTQVAEHLSVSPDNKDDILQHFEAEYSNMVDEINSATTKEEVNIVDFWWDRDKEEEL